MNRRKQPPSPYLTRRQVTSDMAARGPRHPPTAHWAACVGHEAKPAASSGESRYELVGAGCCACCSVAPASGDDVVAGTVAPTRRGSASHRRFVAARARAPARLARSFRLFGEAYCSIYLCARSRSLLWPLQKSDAGRCKFTVRVPSYSCRYSTRSNTLRYSHTKTRAS